MSVFLGKNNNGKPQLHMSTSLASESSLKGGPNIDTLFHSSEKRIIYTKYSNVPFTTMNSTPREPYKDWFNQNLSSDTISLTHFIKPPAALKAQIRSGKGFLVVVHSAIYSYVIVPYVVFNDPFWWINIINTAARYFTGSVAWSGSKLYPDAYGGSAYAITGYPLADSETFAIDIRVAETPTSFDVLCLDWGDNYSWTPEDNTSISVTGGDLQLGNTPFSSQKFIRIGNTRLSNGNTFLPIKGHAAGNTYSYIELVNDPTPTEGSFELTKSKFVNRGRVIVDTSISSYKALSPTVFGSVNVPNWVISGTTVQSREYTILKDSQYKIGDTLLLYFGKKEDPGVQLGGAFTPMVLLSEFNYVLMWQNAPGFQVQANLRRKPNGDITFLLEGRIKNSTGTLTILPMTIQYTLINAG